MKRRYTTLVAAAAVVLLADAFAFVHSARNRSGPVDADMILSDRELYWRYNRDDSGVILVLQQSYDPALTEAVDREALQRIGFDVSVDPVSRDASTFYRRQSVRTAWIALELRDEAPPGPDGKRNETSSRLVLVGADATPEAVRRRYPDRSRVLILPGRVRPEVRPEYRTPQYKPAILYGHVWGFPTDIHVPRPWSDVFRGHRDETIANVRPYRFIVRIRTGGLYEPYVIGAQFSSGTGR